MTYFNANATTPMYKAAAKLIYTLYRQPINVHSDDKLAKQAAHNIKTFQHHITTTFGYKSLFTSCASEANTMAIQSFATKHPNGLIITTLTEHSGVLKSVTATKLPVVYVLPAGQIYDESCAILEHIPQNTPTMVCIIHGNNETGFINDVCTITRLIKQTRPNTHIHIDASQTFCKVFTDASMYNAGVDTITVSFHKIRGPHVGLLMYRDTAALVPIIHGNQQDGMRGGTLSAAIISAANYAYIRNLKNIVKYTQTLRRHRIDIIQQLRASPIRVIDIADARISPDSCIATTDTGRLFDLYSDYHLQIFGLSGANVLPNTILLVVYDPRGVFCNVECKRHLNNNDIVVGIGSACLTNQPTASHIADAYNLNKIQRRGLIRMSFLPKLKNREFAIGVFLEYLLKFM